MPFFSGLDENSAAPDIFTMNPAAGKAFAAYIQAVVEQISPLDRGQRERADILLKAHGNVPNES